MTDDGRLGKTADLSSPTKSPLKPKLHNRFSVAKLEEAKGPLESCKEESPGSPSKRRLIIRSPSTLKTEPQSPFLAGGLRDHKALVEHNKEKTEKKIKINREWRRDPKDNAGCRDSKSLSVDLDCGSPLRTYQGPQRSKSLRQADTSCDGSPAHNTSQLYNEAHTGPRSPVRVSSFRQETDVKFSMPKPKAVPSRPRPDFSIDK